MKFTHQELLEQKALLEKQLDLINSLIEEIEGKTAPAVEAEKPAVQPTPLQAAAASEVEMPDSPATMADTRKGCLLWTAILSALAIAAFALIYVLYPS